MKSRTSSLDSDRTDPIHSAFRQICGVDRRSLEHLSDVDLHAIEQVTEWLGPVAANAPAAPPTAVLASLRAANERTSNVARLTRAPIFGRDDVLGQLDRQIGGPFKVGIAPRSVHVWGAGGVGKSTVLAMFEERLLERRPKAIVVHFDFDRADLDPFSPILLDLELLRQLPVHQLANAKTLEAKRLQLAQVLAGIQADLGTTRRREGGGSQPPCRPRPSPSA